MFALDSRDSAHGFSQCRSGLRSGKLEQAVSKMEDDVAAEEQEAATAGGKGTGGTDLMKFLRPIRDSVAKTHIK